MTLRAYHLLGIAAVVGLSVQPTAANAGLLVYEPFDYAAGANVGGLPATGLNLTGSYSPVPLTQDLVIASPGLTYGSLAGDLPSVSGNRLSDASVAGPGLVTVGLDQDIAIGAGDEIFFSALFTFDGDRVNRVSLIDDDSGNPAQIVFGHDVVGVRAVRVSADTPATGDLIARGADNAFADGQTLWLIGRYFNSADAAGDALEVVGYDTGVTQSIAPTFSLTDPGAQFAFELGNLDIDLAKISSISFEIRGTATHHLDELRIGETYADVTSAAPTPAAVIPEPSTGVLLLVGLAGIGLGRAARRRGRDGSRRAGMGEARDARAAADPAGREGC